MHDTAFHCGCVIAGVQLEPPGLAGHRRALKVVIQGLGRGLVSFGGERLILRDINGSPPFDAQGGTPLVQADEGTAKQRSRS